MKRIDPSQRFGIEREASVGAPVRAFIKSLSGNGIAVKGLYTVFGFCSTVAIASAFILSPTDSQGYNSDQDADTLKTLALAPMSIGNPAAARHGLEMTSPSRPFDAPSLDEIDNIAISQTLKARSGDTLAAILRRAGASGDDATKAIAAARAHFDPRRFRKGQVVKVTYRTNGRSLTSNEATSGRFQGFSLQPNATTELIVARAIDGEFRAWEKERALTKEPVRSEGVITSSLYVAGKKAGMTNAALAELIRAYSWDVDFQRDIRKGDSFEVMYDQIKDDTDRVVKSGTIRYASLTLSGKQHRIYRHKTKDGHTNYYNEKGHSAQKALMRTPIDGARLSSGFGKRRHPVLGYTKMHKGVDFAAPRGTPIYAAGNGTVTYAARKGSFGNYIRIRHNETYSTAYAHMKGFRKGVRKGTRVSQGQVIGYVGTTGRSTGPHLHYEILKNNRQANPLRIKMPSGQKLKGDELAAFLQRKEALDTEFAGLPLGNQKTANLR